MGHTVCVTNQHIAIKKEIQEKLSNEPNCVHIVIDYKMKMIPVYFWEKTIKHYGEKGMSWHGTMLYMKQLPDEASDADC